MAAAGVVVVELLLLLILKVVAGVETGAGAPGVATPAGVVGVVAFVVGVALAPPNENPPPVVVDAAVGVVLLAFEVSGAVAVPKPLNEGAAPGGALCFFPPPSFVAGVGVVAGCEKLNAGAAAAGAFVEGATVDIE